MGALAEEKVDIHAVLADLRDNAPTIRDKGTAFEELVAKYLVSDPLYASRFESVRPYSQWAAQGARRDLGIDLVGLEHDGGVCAIQCKFYGAHERIEKKDVDSFLSESGKHPFTARLIVSTTDVWSTNADDALKGQQIPVARIGLTDLQDSAVEWELFHQIRTRDTLALKAHKTPRKHQREALEAVKAGFEVRDRGKLVMACGTGKTFTALKLVEETVPAGGRVLFMAPSISLVSQSLREWASESSTPMRFFAVCSDSSVGKRRSTAAGADEDISAFELVIPATTNPERLAAGAANAAADGEITVVFSTYQSIDVITEAQRQGLPDFDLIICDEAHRTTGSWAQFGEQSAFTKVHDNANVCGGRRLYMTATPRVYGDDAKAKGAEGAIAIASMDDEALFGPEFHRLDFGTAVDQDLLSDYKVLILTVSEDYVSPALQSTLASSDEITLSDAAKLVGCWNALSKRTTAGDFGDDALPMRRAVAFASSIKQSKLVAEAFGEVSRDLAGTATDGSALRVRTKHVDGTQNALVRGEAIAWLKADDPDPLSCRVLTNARCLSEGVDVPALDAVLFLNPRNSIVDVVQSVGRVMRKAKGKTYGYVVIPVAIPSGVDPEKALNDHKRFKIVWDVLRALRSHDSRLEAEVNTLDPHKRNNRIKVLGIGTGGTGSDRDSSGSTEVQLELDLGDAPVWREAVLARLVKNVGQRMYWDRWGREVAGVVDSTTTRIRGALQFDADAAAEFDLFHAGLRANLNDSISRDDAIGMLAQHLVTAPVFAALFDGYDFVTHNAVAQVMERMLEVLGRSNVQSEQRDLEAFYGSVRERVAHVDDAGRLRFVNELYEKFFKLAFPKVADQLGIVYTPVEVVDFILRGVNDLLISEFGVSLSDPGVQILDPFTGTGTFIVRLLQSGLIEPEALAHKYASELHCNEILLLAYYIAVINIESTYHAVTGASEYEPFTGAVLVDTFQMSEDGDTLDTSVFTTNNDRVVRQRDLPIRVIVGNPPYSVGQTSGNDNAQNLKYPSLDRKIELTYAARSSAVNKNSLYDSYIRAIRWASDRVSDNGIIGFVTNGGFIDANTADGLRLSLADEFSKIYVFNLRGNQRTAGEQSRREGGKVFDSGSRNTVAVTFLVKGDAYAGPTTIHYWEVADYLSRDEKLAITADAAIDSVAWQRIQPNAAGDWINQRSDEFERYAPMGDKKQPGAFRVYTRGVASARDAWVYNFSSSRLGHNISSMVAFYNSEVERLEGQAVAVLDMDPTKISWNHGDETRVARGVRLSAATGTKRASAYRPFCTEYLWFDPSLLDAIYRVPALFPTPQGDNRGIYVVGMGSAVPFSVFATDLLPDLHVTGAGSGGQFFARYTYEPADEGVLDFGGDVIDGYRRIDNITDATLTEYRAHYGGHVTKNDIFAFIYGLLHSPDYRGRFAADLKRMLPRIPLLGPHQFEPFRAAGAELLDLHINYEDAEPWPLEMTDTSVGQDDVYDHYRVTKLRYPKVGKVTDKTTILYNDRITVSGIPEVAQRYMLGSRSGVDWVVDRYQVTTDKASGIVNDPNDWSREVGNPRYILDLIGKVTAVSVRTVEIVEGLPELEIAQE